MTDSSCTASATESKMLVDQMAGSSYTAPVTESRTLVD